MGEGGGGRWKRRGWGREVEEERVGEGGGRGEGGGGRNKLPQGNAEIGVCLDVVTHFSHRLGCKLQHQKATPQGEAVSTSLNRSTPMKG